MLSVLLKPSGKIISSEGKHLSRDLVKEAGYTLIDGAMWDVRLIATGRQQKYIK